jgi:hypothetical protein
VVVGSRARGAERSRAAAREMGMASEEEKSCFASAGVQGIRRCGWRRTWVAAVKWWVEPDRAAHGGRAATRARSHGPRGLLASPKQSWSDTVDMAWYCSYGPAQFPWFKLFFCNISTTPNLQNTKVVSPVLQKFPNLTRW